MALLAKYCYAGYFSSGWDCKTDLSAMGKQASNNFQDLQASQCSGLLQGILSLGAQLVARDI